MKQAYLQSSANLRRDVFFRPKELNLAPDELLQIIKPLYGLTDSGAYWCETFARFHVRDLRMKQSTGDFALFFKRFSESLVALSATYVDDVQQGSSRKLKTYIINTIKSNFDITCDDVAKFVYTSIICDSSNPMNRTLSQSHYIRQLHYLKGECSFDEYRSLRAKLIWATHTRPDIACAVSMASQTMRETFNQQEVTSLNMIIRYLRRSSNITLQYPKLDLNSLSMVVYKDSSHDNVKDHQSQLGFLICLMESTKKCAVIHFISHKPRRVARSSIAAETLAFVESYDNAYLILHDLERMLGREVPLILLTDCKLLFDTITSSRYTTEKRLMIDIAAAREACRIVTRWLRQGVLTVAAITSVVEQVR